MSFVPFYSELTAIRQNVLDYHYNMGRGIFMKLLQSVIPSPLYDWYPLNALPAIKGLLFFWVLSLGIAAYYIQKFASGAAFELYFILLVASTFAFSEQYLAIPLMGAVLFYRFLPFWYYAVFSSYYLIFVSYNNLKPQNWMRIFSIEPRDGAVYIDYTHIQTWLWVLLAAVLVAAARNKRNLSGDFPN
jgi:hypothetical protein